MARPSGDHPPVCSGWASPRERSCLCPVVAPPPGPVPPIPAEAIHFPSGDHAKAVTLSACLVYVHTLRMLSAVQTPTMPSIPAEAIHFPPGDQAMVLTPP